jgi:hypothetical protein
MQNPIINIYINKYISVTGYLITLLHALVLRHPVKHVYAVRVLEIFLAPLCFLLCPH